MMRPMFEVICAGLDAMDPTPKLHSQMKLRRKQLQTLGKVKKATKLNFSMIVSKKCSACPPPPVTLVLI